MTINEHKTEFAGREIITWEPGDPIEDPAGANYRIAVSDDTDAKASWPQQFAAFLKVPNAQQLRGLIIGPWSLNVSGDSTLDVVVDIVRASQILSNLRSLFIGDIIRPYRG